MHSFLFLFDWWRKTFKISLKEKQKPQIFTTWGQNTLFPPDHTHKSQELHAIIICSLKKKQKEAQKQKKNNQETYKKKKKKLRDQKSFFFSFFLLYFVKVLMTDYRKRRGEREGGKKRVLRVGMFSWPWNYAVEAFVCWESEEEWIDNQNFRQLNKY
jgi:hypothetical protein